MFEALITTVTVTVSALFIALAIGVPGAFVVTRWGHFSRRLADALLTVPMVLPPTVIGFTLLWLLGRKGLFGQALYEWFGISIVFSWWAAVVAAAVVCFPLVYRSARRAFDDVDDNLQDAARTMGLSELAVFFRISLPLAKRGLVVGGLLGLTRAMGEFGATLMFAGNLPGKTQTVPLAIFEAVQSGNDKTALILCACALALGFSVLITTELLEERRSA